VSIIKEFTTAAKEATGESEDPVVFSIDEKTLRAYRPTEGQLAMLMMSLARHNSEATKIAGAIDFFVSIMDQESYTYLADRLQSRDNPIALEEITNVVQWLIEEWAGRPTPSPSASTPSPNSDGQNSTPTMSLST
jgi:hypothetical protein